MKQDDPVPVLKVCPRCRGAGVVTTVKAEDYYVEDSSPREVPVATCPACGGTGTEDD